MLPHLFVSEATDTLSVQNQYVVALHEVIEVSRPDKLYTLPNN